MRFIMAQNDSRRQIVEQLTEQLRRLERSRKIPPPVKQNSLSKQDPHPAESPADSLANPDPAAGADLSSNALRNNWLPSHVCPPETSDPEASEIVPTGI